MGPKEHHQLARHLDDYNPVSTSPGPQAQLPNIHAAANKSAITGPTCTTYTTPASGPSSTRLPPATHQSPSSLQVSHHWGPLHHHQPACLTPASVQLPDTWGLVALLIDTLAPRSRLSAFTPQLLKPSVGPSVGPSLFMFNTRLHLLNMDLHCCGAMVACTGSAVSVDCVDLVSCERLVCGPGQL